MLASQSNPRRRQLQLFFVFLSRQRGKGLYHSIQLVTGSTFITHSDPIGAWLTAPCDKFAQLAADLVSLRHIASTTASASSICTPCTSSTDSSPHPYLSIFLDLLWTTESPTTFWKSHSALRGLRDSSIRGGQQLAIA